MSTKILKAGSNQLFLYELYHVRGAEQNKWYCQIYPDRDCPPEYVADLANKFVAAPAIYKELKAIVGFVEANTKGRVPGSVYDLWLQRARAALAQADGEQQ